MAKTPAEIKSLARGHTAAAINVLAGVMNQSEAPPAARVSAACALLDRGWGKPTQLIAGDDDHPGVRLETVQRTIVDPAITLGDTNSEGVQAPAKPEPV